MTATVDEGKSQYETSYKGDYESDWDLHRNYIQTFDPYEAMLIGTVYDSVSNKTDGSKITDSYAATLTRDRADRVMAKLPDGTTVSVGKADTGKALFMDIIRQKWIYPNANAQRPFAEKLNLWQLYSSVYGYMPMFYDWNISNTGYVGPDCWLINPRNLVPQQGKVSIEDMDYITNLVWLSKKKIEDIIANESKGDGWDRAALTELLASAEKTTGNDTQKNTFVERDRNPQGSKKGICFATRYEAGPDGKWCTFCPDNGFIQVRELDNPHKNGRIPFVVKYSQPLFDSFYGLGDFQRAKPIQFARDGLTNFYFANLKRNLAPGIIVNANGVVKHTLDVTKPNPVLMETIPDSIRPMPTNTAGLQTYSAAQSNLTGSLLTLYGTQNASSPGSETLNPSQGKTPAAINMFSNVEATRDGAERRHLETAIEQLTDGFSSMIVGIGTESIPIDLFAEDIKEIAKSAPDLNELFDGKLEPDKTGTSATLRIDPKVLKGVEYRFNIEPNSTAKINKQEQLQELETFVDNLGKFQNIFKDDSRIDFHPEKIAEAYASLTDIPGASEFVSVNNGPSPQEQQMQQQLQEMQQKLQAAEQKAQAKPPFESIKFTDVVGAGATDAAAAMLTQAGLPSEGLTAAMSQASPAQPPEPIANATGVYTNPHVAAAADLIHKMTTNRPDPAPGPTPIANEAGVFTNPHIAAAASTIHKMHKTSKAAVAKATAAEEAAESPQEAATEPTA